MALYTVAVTNLDTNRTRMYGKYNTLSEARDAADKYDSTKFHARPVPLDR